MHGWMEIVVILVLLLLLRSDEPVSIPMILNMLRRMRRRLLAYLSCGGTPLPVCVIDWHCGSWTELLR